MIARRRVAPGDEMKVVFLPLKLVTEALWLVGKVARKVTGRAPPPARPVPSSPPPPPAREPAAPRATAPTRGGGGGSAAFAAVRSQEVRRLAVGDAVRLPAGATVGGRAVPAGAEGRVESAAEGRYAFLWYGDDGVPVVVRDLGPEALSPR